MGLVGELRGLQGFHSHALLNGPEAGASRWAMASGNRNPLPNIHNCQLNVESCSRSVKLLFYPVSKTKITDTLPSTGLKTLCDWRVKNIYTSQIQFL